MSYEDEIRELESEWMPEDGFFWKIRQGQFSEEDFRRALTKVSNIPIPNDALLPRRLVSLLWYIPLFMQWQTERVQENGGDIPGLSMAITTMTNKIERLLGVP
ncbi:MAG: hypothetical protein M5U26_19575 [Planctomycetota bacterium]|nr:hypothetical protein [Planctomycetota bacterium]